MYHLSVQRAASRSIERFSSYQLVKWSNVNQIHFWPLISTHAGVSLNADCQVKSATTWGLPEGVIRGTLSPLCSLQKLFEFRASISGLDSRTNCLARSPPFLHETNHLINLSILFLVSCIALHRSLLLVCNSHKHCIKPITFLECRPLLFLRHFWCWSCHRGWLTRLTLIVFEWDFLICCMVVVSGVIITVLGWETYTWPCIIVLYFRCNLSIEVIFIIIIHPGSRWQMACQSWLAVWRVTQKWLQAKYLHGMWTSPPEWSSTDALKSPIQIQSVWIRSEWSVWIRSESCQKGTNTKKYYLLLIPHRISVLEAFSGPSIAPIMCMTH